MTNTHLGTPALALIDPSAISAPTFTDVKSAWKKANQNALFDLVDGFITTCREATLKRLFASKATWFWALLLTLSATDLRIDSPWALTLLAVAALFAHLPFFVFLVQLLVFLPMLPFAKVERFRLAFLDYEPIDRAAYNRLLKKALKHDWSFLDDVNDWIAFEEKTILQTTLFRT